MFPARMRQRSGNAGSFEHDPEDALHGSREALPMLTAPDGAVLGVLPSHHAAYSHYMGEFGSAPGPNGLGEGGPGAPALYTAARGTAAGSAGYNKLHKPLRRKSAVAGRRLPRWALWSILALAALNCLQWVLSRHQALVLRRHRAENDVERLKGEIEEECAQKLMKLRELELDKVRQLNEKTEQTKEQLRKTKEYLANTKAALAKETATLDARTEELAQLRGACAATQAQLLLLQKGQQLAGLGIGEDADASADTAENTAGVGGEIPKEAGDYEYVYE
mmetsp:Transcript_5077/g.18465  ORF Transcript_5077/g.18465 Transcript_5077/m.18465 type:complete len:278 (-) Transcript_5077:3326-4159(-)